MYLFYITSPLFIDNTYTCRSVIFIFAGGFLFCTTFWWLFNVIMRKLTFVTIFFLSIRPIFKTNMPFWHQQLHKYTFPVKHICTLCTEFILLCATKPQRHTNYTTPRIHDAYKNNIFFLIFYFKLFITHHELLNQISKPHTHTRFEVPE